MITNPNDSYKYKKVILSCMANQKGKRDYAKLALYMIIAAFLLRVIFSVIVYPSSDGAWHLGVAKFIAETYRIPVYDTVGRYVFGKPFLFNIAVAFVYKISILFGEGFAVFMMKLVSPVSGTISLILTFLITRKLFSEKTAFYTTLFCSFFPINLYFDAKPYSDTFFVMLFLLAAYFALEGRYILAGVAGGFNILAKETGILVIPLIIAIIAIQSSKKGIFAFPKKDEALTIARRSAVFLAITLLVGAPYFLFQYVHFGDPIWPYAGAIFKDSAKFTPLMYDSHPGLDNFFRLETYNGLLQFFGLPAGRIETFKFLNIPFINLMIAIWIIGCFLYMVPFFFGLSRMRLKEQRFQTVLSFFLLFLVVGLILPTIMYGEIVPRYFMPAVMTLGIFWALGIEMVEKIRYRNLIFAALALLMIGYAASTAAIHYGAAQQWHKYDQDFSSMRTMIPEGSSVFTNNAQEFYYVLGRPAINSHSGLKEYSNAYHADYVLINQQFVQASLHVPEDFADEIRHSDRMELVYSNPETGMELYHNIAKT